jgi:thymidine phosphorylase
MIEAQEGDPRVVDDPTDVLPRAPVVTPVEAGRPGYVGSIEAEALGWAAVRLGAGRARKDDPVDPAVGLVCTAKVGDRVEAGQPIGEVHAREEEAARRAAGEVLGAVELTDEAVDPLPLVYGWRDA